MAAPGRCGSSSTAPHGPELTTVHVSAPRQLRLGGVAGHHRPLPKTSRRVYRSVPVTSPEQTILDLAASLTETQLGECIDDALRRKLIRLDRLHALVVAASGPGRRLIRPVRRALADRGVGYDPGANSWEKAMDRQLDQCGLPGVRQFRVHVNGRRYRIDRAIPELKIGIEWNGYETHGTRSGFDRDSDKRADLTAAGWHMLDFTPRSSPPRICRAIQAAIEQRQTTWDSPPT